MSLLSLKTWFHMVFQMEVRPFALLWLTSMFYPPPVSLYSAAHAPHQP